MSGEGSSLQWVELGAEIVKRYGQKKVGKIVIVMDVLEIGTDQKVLRSLSHSHPDFSPIKMKDITLIKRSEIYEMQMVTHEV